MASDTPPAADAPAFEHLDYMGVDAQKWAQQFINTFRGEVVSDNGHVASVDAGLMIGWFANAIEAGHSQALQRGISVLAVQVNDTAHAKGWWGGETKRLFDGVLMLIVSEAAEALEEWRNNKKEDEGYFSIPAYRPDLTIYPQQDLRDRIFTMERDNVSKLVTMRYMEENFTDDEQALLIQTGFLKPEGIPSELADIVIRVFDAAVEYGIDIEEEIISKMAYNATRATRHGGKRS